MTTSHLETRKPLQEHSVPWFWPSLPQSNWVKKACSPFRITSVFLAEAQLIKCHACASKADDRCHPDDLCPARADGQLFGTTCTHPLGQVCTSG